MKGIEPRIGFGFLGRQKVILMMARLSQVLKAGATNIVQRAEKGMPFIRVRKLSNK